jgi:hypothetical protein
MDLLDYKEKDFIFEKTYYEYYKNEKYVQCWEYLQRARNEHKKYKEVLIAQEKANPKGEVYLYWDKIKKLAQRMPPAPTGTAASAPRTAGSGASAARTAGSAGARTVGPGASAAKPADTPETVARTAGSADARTVGPGASAAKPADLPETAAKAAAPVPTTGGTGGGAEIVVHGADEDNAYDH